MSSHFRALALLPLLALGACATSPTITTLDMNASPASAPVEQQVLQAPAQTVSSAAAMTDASSFVDAGAYAQLTDKSKAEVAGAQFNALQFGRVGAPRNWQGDKGQSGMVTVGPYVRVNLIDCRDFTNTVTLGGQSFVKKGTACRETDGHWSLSATKTG
jgi:surface antigen